MDIDLKEASTDDRYKWLTATVIPRPIAWVTTQDREGRLNAAPFSFFTVLAASPPLIGIVLMRRAGRPKDTLANIEATGEFVVNLVTAETLAHANQTSIEAPPEFDEFGYAGLTPRPSRRVAPPGIRESPVHLECRLRQVIAFGDPDAPGHPTALIVGEVLLITIDDRFVHDGHVDFAGLSPVGRLGGPWYQPGRDPIRLYRPVYPPEQQSPEPRSGD